MKSYFLRYFLPWIIGSELLFAFVGIFREENSAVMNILALVFAVIISCTFYFLNTKWGPQLREKKMNRSPFTEFYELGFEKESEYAIGWVDGYQILVRYEWAGVRGKPSISFETFFDPRIDGGIISLDTIKALHKKYRKEGIYWNRNFLTKEWNYNFKAPDFESIYPFVQRSVELLQSENIPPMSLRDATALAPAFEKQIEEE